MNNLMRLPVILGVMLSFPISGYTQDNVPPNCEATFVGLNANNERFAQFTTRDNQALLNTTITEMVNSTVSVYAPEDNTLSIFRATKIDQNERAIIHAEVTDKAGNLSQCIDAIVVKGNSVKKIYPNIPKKAGNQIIVHVQNANPGIAQLEIMVNNTLHTLALNNGEYKTQDISSSMLEGNNNTISLKGIGDPASTAYLIIYGD